MMARCDFTELPTEGCAHCRTPTATPAPAKPSRRLCQNGTRHSDTWHSSQPAEQAEARAVCWACPERPACQTAVLAAEAGFPAEDRHGIWAALDGEQRAELDPTTPIAQRGPDCGLFSTYRRHKRRGEPIDDDCHQAALKEWAEARKRRQTRAARHDLTTAA